MHVHISSSPFFLSFFLSLITAHRDAEINAIIERSIHIKRKLFNYSPTDILRHHHHHHHHHYHNHRRHHHHHHCHFHRTAFGIKRMEKSCQTRDASKLLQKNHKRFLKETVKDEKLRKRLEIRGIK
uniref:Uncharacterized protein n=1 Tax=Octopus bimaculoides TaxID=37653 RepID=A0A0L8I1K2_OCTBM